MTARRRVVPGTAQESASLRIVHLSDIHFWQYAFNPLRLLSKRLVGTAELLLGRARRFRLERAPELVARVSGLHADHILITGDLTTTALPNEFRAARSVLSDWLGDPGRVTIIPGNHDRYTMYAHRSQRFEQYFGRFSPQSAYPWVRPLGDDTGILGLDPTRPRITARGRLPRHQLERARQVLAESGPIRRLLVACHYPVTVPAEHKAELARKPLANADDLVEWLGSIGPHLYCCGHVHAAWAYRPYSLPNQLCLNPGAPLLRDRTGRHPPGFLEITLAGPDVTVVHHAWVDGNWEVRKLCLETDFFPLRHVT
jgi:3',5'-cyclic AMP phosphodiesterase CpdA